MAEKRKAFADRTPWGARSAALDWLRNFRDHGPLDIKSIKVNEERGGFVAVVIYAEMAIEPTPQYFANYRPMLKSA